MGGRPAAGPGLAQRPQGAFQGRASSERKYGESLLVAGNCFAAVPFRGGTAPRRHCSAPVLLRRLLPRLRAPP